MVCMTKHSTSKNPPLSSAGVYTGEGRRRRKRALTKFRYNALRAMIASSLEFLSDALCSASNKPEVPKPDAVLQEGRLGFKIPHEKC